MLPLQKAQFYAQCKAYLRLNEQLCRMLHEYEIQNTQRAYYNNYYNTTSYTLNQCYLNLQARSIHDLLPYHLWNPHFGASLIACNSNISAIKERYEPPGKWFPRRKTARKQENPQHAETRIVEEPVQENHTEDTVVEESSQDAPLEPTEDILSIEDSPPESPTAELCNIDLQVLDINEQTLNELLENKENLGDGGVFDELLEGYFSDSSQTLFIDTDYESDKEKDN